MSRSIEIIQKSGANALVYGNNTAHPGEHVEVFTGPDALERAQQWRLEQPIEKTPEYVIPEHVLRMDASLAAQDAAAAPAEFLGTLEHVALWQKRLAKAQALEAAALDVLAHWARTLAAVTKVREATERCLSAAQAGREATEGDKGAADAAEPQTAAQAVAGAREALGLVAKRAVFEFRHPGKRVIQDITIAEKITMSDSLLKAPIDAVDLGVWPSVKPEPQLSDGAKSALLSAEVSAQGSVPKNMSAGETVELQRAGLVGPGEQLTRAGGIMRDKLINAAEDAAFGEM